jgi:hypothetical protein
LEFLGSLPDVTDEDFHRNKSFPLLLSPSMHIMG